MRIYINAEELETVWAAQFCLFLYDCRCFEGKNEENEAEKLFSLMIEIEKKVTQCLQLQQEDCYSRTNRNWTDRPFLISTESICVVNEEAKLTRDQTDERFSARWRTTIAQQDRSSSSLWDRMIFDLFRVSWRINRFVLSLLFIRVSHNKSCGLSLEDLSHKSTSVNLKK
jgi:hypothetical protein